MLASHALRTPSQMALSVPRRYRNACVWLDTVEFSPSVAKIALVATVCHVLQISIRAQLVCMSVLHARQTLSLMRHLHQSARVLATQTQDILGIPSSPGVTSVCHAQ